ncbi:MAG: PepSY domain-containing protein, partial [Beijerinckiaceae bacterium]
NLDAAKLQSMLAKYDPNGAAVGLTLRSYDNSLQINDKSGSLNVVVDLDTLQPKAALGLLAQIFEFGRKLHMDLLYGLRPLVVLTTAALVLTIVFGLLLGLPHRRNTFSGWHRMLAWSALPLLLAIPVTGILMHLNVTFGGGDRAPMHIGQARIDGARMAMAQIVVAGARHRDLGQMAWIRNMGPRYMMRYRGDNRFRGYFITANGVSPAPPNLPRGFHEGLWFGRWGGFLNFLVSVAFLALWVTGLTMFFQGVKRRHRPSVPQA